MATFVSKTPPPPHASTTRKHRGRPPVSDHDKKDVFFTIRLTKEQAARLTHLGGATWIRNMIEVARY